MSNQAKVLRGQLKQVVLENLPEVLKAEIFKEIQKQNDSRLSAIDKHIRQTLQQLEEKQKDFFNSIIRQSVLKNPTVKE